MLIKKILLVSFSCKPKVGGLEAFTENLTERLKKKGIDVVIASALSVDDSKSRKDDNSIKVEKLLPNISWVERGHWLNNIFILFLF